MSKIDANAQTIGKGLSLTDSITPIPLTLDPITNRLLMEGVGEVIVPTAVDKSRIDQNDQNTVYGVSNTDGKTLIPIRTDSNGYLLITF